MAQVNIRAVWNAAVLFCVLLAAACSPAADPARGTQTEAQTAVTPGAGLPAASESRSTAVFTPTTDTGATAGATATPPPVLTESPLLVVTDIDMEPGPVPDELVSQMIQDLAERLGIGSGAVAVVSAESKVWNDSSLGCPEPGMFYTQVLTPGYQVILEATGEHYDYRSDSAGNFKLCGG